MSGPQMRWRNQGAPFTAADGPKAGKRIGTGEEFAAAADSETVVRRRRKLEPVGVDAAASVDEVTPEASPVDAADRLAGVPFGSDAARRAAEDAGLDALDFMGRGPGSGEDGAWLVDDVRELAEDHA